MAPGAAHYFGTDSIGNDIYSNTIRGARTSLIVGFVAVATSTLTGVLVGRSPDSSAAMSIRR